MPPKRHTQPKPKPKSLDTASASSSEPKRAPIPSPLLHILTTSTAVWDILLIIFSLLVQDEALITVEVMGVHFGEEKYPWILTQVCKRWRTICLDNATLWSHINVKTHGCPGPSAALPCSAPPSRIRLQLERSKNSPLYINMRSLLCQCPSEIALFTALAAHSARWKAVEFGYWGSTHNLFKGIVGRNTTFPNLEKVVFDGHHIKPERWKSAIPFSLDSNASLTGLRSLTLVQLPSIKSLANVPWGQLTDLTFSNFSKHTTFHSLLSILPRCDNLASFELQFLPDYQASSADAEAVPIGSVVLPRLQSMTLGTSDSFHGWQIIPFLVTPALRKLKYGELVPIEEPKSLITLTDFIKRSSCSITALDIDFIGSEDQSETMLQSLPHLEFLAIREGMPCSRILYNLTNEPQKERLCPALKHLHLYDPLDLMDRQTEPNQGNYVEQVRRSLETVIKARRSEVGTLTTSSTTSSLLSVRIFHPVVLGDFLDEVKEFQRLLTKAVRVHIDAGLKVEFYMDPTTPRSMYDLGQRYNRKPEEILLTNDPYPLVAAPEEFNALYRINPAATMDWECYAVKDES